MSEPTKQAVIYDQKKDRGKSSKKREANNNNNNDDFFHLYNIATLLKHIW